MPIKSYFFNHFIVPSSFIRAEDNIAEDDNIDNYTGKHMKAVKASDKEEKICKLAPAVLVMYQVSAFYHLNRGFYLLLGFATG